METSTVAVPTHPEALDIEFVHRNFERLLLKIISSFSQLNEDRKDLYQDLMVALTRVSPKLGTSYLERYNPSRGSVCTYVTMFTKQYFIKRLRQQQKMPSETPVSLEQVALTDLPHVEPEDFKVIATPQDLTKLLGNTRYAKPSSYTSTGEPRSTLYMLELYLWHGLDIVEVAARMELSTPAVRQRFQALRKEPWAQKLAEGWALRS